MFLLFVCFTFFVKEMHKYKVVLLVFTQLSMLTLLYAILSDTHLQYGIYCKYSFLTTHHNLNVRVTCIVGINGNLPSFVFYFTM